VTDYDSINIAVQDLQAGQPGELLAEADVVIAVDASSGDEEVLYGEYEWRLATQTGQEGYLTVIRVELDLESDDPDWLVEALEMVKRGQPESSDDNYNETEDSDD